MSPWSIPETRRRPAAGSSASRQHLDGTFCLTYGDGLSDVNITDLVTFHGSQGRAATLTAVQPQGRFGVIDFDDEKVAAFRRSRTAEGGWINGGFFVLEPRVLDLIDGDDTVWEHGPMEQLARDAELSAYQHAGFWQPMDTLRDKTLLESLWASGRAPWKVW